MPLSLAQLRRNYTLYGLRDDGEQDNPLVLFGQWLSQARKTEVPPAEANSMALATVDSEGCAHCRILLLKGFSAEGFVFFGNYQSAKGDELASNPQAAMTFFWPGLERQVRIEGAVERFAGQQPPRPEHWGGYCLKPRRIEFWQGRPDRLHDRLDYRLRDGAWQRTRLAP